VAAPTSVRVEATSISTTVLRWAYAGSAGVSVYRSTDGVTYASIVDGLAPSTTSYTDTGLATATKYWYKLTDDAGATFSSIVTVWTHTCLDSPDGSDSFSLPRVDPPSPTHLLLTKREQRQQSSGGTLHADPVEDQVASISDTVGAMADGVNDMAKRVEEVLGARVLEPQQCTACPVDGALVINCASGCHDWVVIADEDINSISMQWCDNGQANVEFVIPPNTTRRICGFAAGFGFTGDECTQAPIVTGSAGRSVTVGTQPASSGKVNPKATGSKPGTGGGGPGSGGGSGSCNCVPSSNGALTIKSCTANNSLDCTSTKSLNLIACGGRGPYTWSHTGSVALSRTAGATTTVTPPTNAGSGVAGVAYKECHYGNNGAGGCNTTLIQFEDALTYGCNDVLIGCVLDGSNCVAPSAAILTCIDALGTCSIPQCAGSCVSHGNHTKQTAVDTRTAPMIAANCNPCGVSTVGQTVTVTDAVGTQTTVILRN